MNVSWALTDGLSYKQDAGCLTLPPLIMNDQIKSEQKKNGASSYLLLNSRFFAKIALIVGVLSCFGIVLVLFFVAGKTGGSYGAISRSFSLSQQSLGPTMLIAGLILVAFAGFITWVFALYTSHYIAGPLFGFARNFEIMMEHGVTAPAPMRKNDRLKQEDSHIRRSIGKLQEHYGEMRSAAEAALSQIDTSPNAGIVKLKKLDHAVRL